MSRIGYQYNIPKQIIDEASKHPNLDALATGGGLDYIYREIGTNADWSQYVMTLSDCKDAGSPEDLNGPCRVTVWLDETWTQGLDIGFGSVMDAMTFMGYATDIALINLGSR